MPLPSPMRESEGIQSCLTLQDPMDCSLPGTSVHGIFQARVLEWVAIAFSCLPLVLLRIKHFQKESKREGKVKMQEPHIPLSIALGNARPCFLTWHFQLPPTQLAPRPAPSVSESIEQECGSNGVAIRTLLFCSGLSQPGKGSSETW